MPHRRALPASLALTAAPAAGARAQDVGRPIRWVVPFPPGGATDAMARFTARGLGKALPATIVVERR